MHFRLPKPLHGWRAFVGEVGIIVIGVLIALGAEQVVEGIHLKQETSDARDQIRRELAGDYVLSEERRQVRACLDRQIDVLETAVLESEAVLRPVPLQQNGFGKFVYRAPSRPWPVHVFENVQGEEVYAHFSESERDLLGKTYTQLHDMQLMNDEEDNAVGTLMVLAKPLPLDAGVKAHLLEILEAERRRADLMAVIAPQVMDQAMAFGARPDPQRAAQFLRESGTLMWCKARPIYR